MFHYDRNHQVEINIIKSFCLEKNILQTKSLHLHVPQSMLLDSWYMQIQVSHEKNPYYFPLYWLVNKDPYNGLLYSLYTWVV